MKCVEVPAVDVSAVTVPEGKCERDYLGSDVCVCVCVARGGWGVSGVEGVSESEHEK